MRYADKNHSKIFLNILTRLQRGNDKKHINHEYSQTSDIRRTLVGNKIVDHSYIVGTSPIGAAPTTSSFST